MAQNRFCSNCGRSIEAGVQFCTNCGAGNHGGGASDPEPTRSYASGPAFDGQEYTDVPNYLVQAILVTIFCCLPLGIVAIVFAAQVNGKLASGDYQRAVSTSSTAKTWCWASFGVGLGLSVLWILAVGCSALLGL